MSVLLFAYVCMLTAFETLSLSNLMNKESESVSENLKYCCRFYKCTPKRHVMHDMAVIYDDFYGF